MAIKWIRTHDGKPRVFRRDLLGKPVGYTTGPRRYEGVSEVTGKRYAIEAKGRGYVLTGQTINGTLTTTGTLATTKESAEWYDSRSI
jgi:hypothetical protein